MSTALETAKAEARRAARALRAKAANPAAAAALVFRFPLKLRQRSPVAGYWPVGAEIDCRPLLSSLAGGGADLALPRMSARDQPPVFLRWSPGGELTADAFGMLAPPEGAQEIEPEVVLCPLLAFDRAGRRLGQGGGHYDRILARLKPRGVIAVGLAFAAQEIPEVPAGALDQRLDWIVTEREAIDAAKAL